MNAQSAALLLKRASGLLPYVFFLIAAYFVQREISAYPMREIAEHLRNMPPRLIALAILLTAINYALLSIYDWLALKYAGKMLPWPRILQTSLISYAITNNAGHALVSGTAARYRFYGAYGISGWDVLKIALFSSITFMLAAFTVEAGLSLFFPEIMFQGQAAPKLVHGVTLISAAALGFYWIGVLFVRAPLRFKSIEFRMPSWRLAVAQTLIGVFELMLSGSILYLFILHGNPDMPFVAFIAIYVLAILAGLASQVPGGLGVFEGTVILLAGPQFSAPHILSALILYRIVYFFLPLVGAGIGLFLYEMRHHRDSIVKGGTMISNAMSQSVPAIFSLLLFFSGVLLLVSGSTPTVPDHLEWVQWFVPLPVVEFSHLLGSLIGVLLLFLARAVRLRLDAAWYGCIILLTLGAVASILKGFDWKEATALTVMLIMIAPTRRHFDRHASLLRVSLTPSWIAMIAIALIGSSWIGFFAYRHVEYANQMWWQFSYRDDAPRFLRALLVSGALVTCYAFYRLLTVARPGASDQLSTDELAEAAAVAAGSHDTAGFLSLLGDKTLLWNDDRRAFIMYSTVRKYWIAMGDPVGDPAAFEALTWKFRECADKHGAQTVFYQVSERYLPLYLDLGLMLVKIGEYAWVDARNFSLAGGKRENQRKGRNRMRKDGYDFRIVERQDVPALLPRLRVISDAWLAQKNAREKGFSLGFFDESYLARTRIAVIEREGRILAFANLWELDDKRAVTVDLMRYEPGAATNMMEFLLVELILWAQEQGVARFGLGMAPLSGLEKHQLAPLWHKIGNVIFEHGEEFYNFEGLYAYKSKFDPDWQPRYIAAPSGLHMPLVLMSIASLISGGLQGVFRK